MVESPKDPPNSEFGVLFDPPTVDTPKVIETPDDSNIDPSPIDVNVPRDTSNIFYAYDEPETVVSDSQAASDIPETATTTGSVNISVADGESSLVDIDGDGNITQGSSS